MLHQGMFQSSGSEWETPNWLFQYLNHVCAGGQIALDVCATAKNAKCSRYFTKADNGLVQSWEGNVCWMNPPYGREIRHWVQKAFEEGKRPGTLVVSLLPARTDTSWWHDYVMRSHKIYLLRGRVQFISESGRQSPAPFPSAVVVFNDIEHPRDWI